MVNLDQAQKNVRNAQDQLDQALKELEKAKKPQVETLDVQDGIFQYTDQFGSYRMFSIYKPCKVTVRPLGGPEPVVVSEQILGVMPRDVREMCYRAGMDGRQLVQVVVTPV